MKPIKQFFLTAGISLFFPVAAPAQFFVPDNTFGNSGIVSMQLGQLWIPRSIEVQSDGKILVGGTTDADYALLRFNTDGTPDTTFGNSGKVIQDFGLNETLGEMILQSDGKILVVGMTGSPTLPSSYIFITRYLPNGNLDSTFGSNGVFTGNASITMGYAIAIQNDGKIIVGGLIVDNHEYLLLMRVDAGGQQDLSFGNGNGILKLDFYSEQAHGLSIALQSDGKIIATGQAQFNSQEDIFVARFNTDGTPDTGFGVGGKRILNWQNSDGAKKVLVRNDDKIIVAGLVQIGLSAYSVIVQLLPDGSFDNTYGTNGIITTEAQSMNGYTLGTEGAILQGDGKIVLSGLLIHTSVTNPALHRYNTDGTVDLTFDTDGIVAPPLGNQGFLADVAIQGDGKFVGVGRNFGTNQNLLLVRYGESPVGLKENTYSSGFLPYPNPTSGILTVGDRIENIEVSDMCGKIIFSGKPEKSQIDLSGIGKGIYFVRMSAGDQIRVQKVIIE